MNQPTIASDAQIYAARGKVTIAKRLDRVISPRIQRIADTKTRAEQGLPRPSGANQDTPTGAPRGVFNEPLRQKMHDGPFHGLIITGTMKGDVGHPATFGGNRDLTADEVSSGRWNIGEFKADDEVRSFMVGPGGQVHEPVWPYRIRKSAAQDAPEHPET